VILFLRKPIFLRVRGFILVCTLVSLLVVSPVKADVGVQPVLPGGSSIKPGEVTPIQMAAEVVTINVRQATEADNTVVKLNPDSYGYGYQPVWFVAVAEVEADFTMKNPTNSPVSMTVWFPLASALENVDWNFNPGEIVPRIQDFEVKVDGTPLEYAVSELPNPKGADKPLLPWASFPVTFPGGKDALVNVSYRVPLQPSPKDYLVAVYYIFQTGAGWAGPIGQAELILNLPYPASEETMGSRAKLNLPYMTVGKMSKGVLAGVVLEGNKARWTWKDFEPGPEDDFAVMLLRPAKWQELEAAREAVQTDPQDGQAWLQLALQYHSLSAGRTGAPLFFSPYYLPLGKEAYQKAAALLPEDPTPHTCLGILTLVQYWGDSKHTPPSVIQSVQEELRIAKELEARNPSLVNVFSSSDLEEILGTFLYNDATATVDAATRVSVFTTMTALATQEYATRTVWAVMKATSLACWATSGKACFTPSPISTLTPEPSPSLTPVPSALPTPGLVVPTFAIKGHSLLIMGSVIVASLVLIGFITIAWKRKGSGK
jgi:hypothetical protein